MSVKAGDSPMSGDGATGENYPASHTKLKASASVHLMPVTVNDLILPSGTDTRACVHASNRCVL
ncbi:MAG: hypothetical protein NVS4B2_08770 [Chloroflexota bacterium]